jgi:hypothetical protein
MTTGLSSKLSWPFRSRKNGLEAPAGVLVLPLLLALVGLWLSDKFASEQRQQESDRQKGERDADFERSVVTKSGGKDSVELLANVKRLDLHLLRRSRLIELEALASSVGSRAEAIRQLRGEHLDSIADMLLMPERATRVSEELKQRILFEEKAAFFFYGNFRARTVTLRTHADIAFSRRWLDDAFFITVDCLLENLGGGPEHSLAVSTADEAAVFGHFGLQRRSLLETLPLLTVAEPAPSNDGATLNRAFLSFRTRLGSQTIDAHGIDVGRVRLSVMAMHAIVYYSLHSVLPPSYGARSAPPPLEMPIDVPDGFRHEVYYWPDVTVESVWNYIYKRVSAARLAGDLGETVQVCK